MEIGKKSYPTISEIIPTRGYREPYIKKWLYTDKIISFDYGNGASYARNKGALIGEGEILFFRDDDVTPENNIFAKLVGKFYERDCIAIVCSQDNIDAYENLASIHFNNRIRYNHSLLPDYIDMIYGSCFAILRKYWEPFDETISGVEDVEFGMRIAKKGKIYHAKDITFIHTKHITLLQLLKNDYKRTQDRLQLFRMTGKKVQSNPNEQILSAMFWWNPIIFAYLNRGYLRFTATRYGWWMAFKLYCLMIVDMAVVSGAICLNLKK